MERARARRTDDGFVRPGPVLAYRSAASEGDPPLPLFRDGQVRPAILQESLQVVLGDPDRAAPEAHPDVRHPAFAAQPIDERRRDLQPEGRLADFHLTMLPSR